jgi:hypothetical protein
MSASATVGEGTFGFGHLDVVPAREGCYDLLLLLVEQYDANFPEVEERRPNRSSKPRTGQSGVPTSVPRSMDGVLAVPTHYHSRAEMEMINPPSPLL